MVSVCALILLPFLMNNVPAYHYQTQWRVLVNALLPSQDEEVQDIVSSFDWQDSEGLVGRVLNISQPRHCQEKDEQRVSKEDYYCREFWLPKSAVSSNLALATHELQFMDYLPTSYVSTSETSRYLLPSRRGGLEVRNRIAYMKAKQIGPQMLAQAARVIAPFCAEGTVNCEPFMREFAMAWRDITATECDVQTCWEVAQEAFDSRSYTVNYPRFEQYNRVLRWTENAIWKANSTKLLGPQLVEEYVKVRLIGDKPKLIQRYEQIRLSIRNLDDKEDDRIEAIAQFNKALAINQALSFDPIRIRVLDEREDRGAKVIEARLTNQETFHPLGVVYIGAIALLLLIAIVHLLLFFFSHRRI